MSPEPILPRKWFAAAALAALALALAGVMLFLRPGAERVPPPGPQAPLERGQEPKDSTTTLPPQPEERTADEKGGTTPPPPKPKPPPKREPKPKPPEHDPGGHASSDISSDGDGPRGPQPSEVKPLPSLWSLLAGPVMYGAAALLLAAAAFWLFYRARGGTKP